MYVQEVLEGHEERCKREFRMETHVFKALVKCLKDKRLISDTKYVSVEEQISLLPVGGGKWGCPSPDIARRGVRGARQDRGKKMAAEVSRRGRAARRVIVTLAVVACEMCARHASSREMARHRGSPRDGSSGGRDPRRRLREMRLRRERGWEEAVDWRGQRKGETREKSGEGGAAPKKIG
ncbi:hypothetical protein ACMD2_10098 [Ananas comosus]|uniref:DUF8040 domain-containing protein n=1 Tax=Ananas comosus TaxID=4615 RepID=A0A199V672_ANACO|nr:hypothetical protein ACMD2_10098 [Ananas comosus]